MNTTNATSSNFDDYGATVYTVIVLIFYSSSLILSLVVNLISSENLADKNRTNDTDDEKDYSLRNKRDILDQLSNVDLRIRYWKIYYGEKNDETISRRFSTNETKLLSSITKRKQELNLKQMKTDDDFHHSDHRESKRIFTRNSQKSTAAVQSKCRRTRSTSMPGIFKTNSSIRQ